MGIIEFLKGKIIVSSQAMPDEPMYKEDSMRSMMQSVVNGGAEALRVAGARDVKIAKSLNVVVIGITKPSKLPENWKETVYITPTVNDTKELIEAGADIIAFDGTMRTRPNNESLNDIIKFIHSQNKIAMADISNLHEGLNSALLGADIISTTLAGYTKESESSPADSPDYELLEKLVQKINKPIFLEGRIWEPYQVQKAFDMGAHSVVIGSAITRPQLITKRFINYKNNKD